MRLPLYVMALLVAAAVASPAQTSASPQPFVSADCGFRVGLHAGWKVKPSASKKCAFTLTRDGAEGKVEFTVRKDTAEQGEVDLGFANQDGKWVLKGDDSVDAEVINAATWTGIEASLGGRPKEGSARGQDGAETRVLLFDHKNRIAEFIGSLDEASVYSFVEGFEFLSQPAS